MRHFYGAKLLLNFHDRVKRKFCLETSASSSQFGENDVTQAGQKATHQLLEDYFQIFQEQREIRLKGNGTQKGFYKLIVFSYTCSQHIIHGGKYRKKEAL